MREQDGRQEIGQVGLKVDVPAAAPSVRDSRRGATEKQSKHGVHR